jgi:hypothetical protein
VERSARGGETLQRGEDDAPPRLLLEIGIDDRVGAHRSHPPGIGAAVAVFAPLVVHGVRQCHRLDPAAGVEQRCLGADETLLEDHGGTRGAEPSSEQAGCDLGALLHRVGEKHPLAAGETVGLDHRRESNSARAAPPRARPTTRCRAMAPRRRRRCGGRTPSSPRVEAAPGSVRRRDAGPPRASPRPATSGISGPGTTRSTCSLSAASTRRGCRPPRSGGSAPPLPSPDCRGRHQVTPVSSPGATHGVLAAAATTTRTLIESPFTDVRWPAVGLKAGAVRPLGLRPVT